MSSSSYGALGIAGTLAAGLVARRLIVAQDSFAGRHLSVALWIAAAGLVAAAAIAFLAPHRPYVTGTLSGAAGVVAAAAAVFWGEYSAAWVPVALAAAFGTGAFGAFLGISTRWTVRGGDRTAA